MSNEKLNEALVANEVATAEENNVKSFSEMQVDTSAPEELFESATPTRVIGGANQLNKTAHLTAVATGLVNQIMDKVLNDRETYAAQVLASQKSHDAMDDLIGEAVNLGAVDVEFLEDVSEDEIDKMIRSQQSKRSRAKAKAMTQENYRTMMIGAVSENLLRIAGGKPKNSGGGGAVMGEIGYSDEDIEKYIEFPEELKKEIRNIQSKKSIMRSKADFDEQNPRWGQLLKAEQQLKDVRDRISGVINQEATQAIELKKQAEEMLASVDLEDIPADEAVDLLNKMKEMLATR